MVHPKSAKLA